MDARIQGAQLFDSGGRMPVTLAEDSPVGRRGQVVMLSLQPSDVHEVEELSTFLFGYKNASFRADEASRVVFTDNDEFKFRSFSSDDTYRRVNVKGSIDGAIPQIDPKTSLTQTKVVDRFIGSFINDVTKKQASVSYNLEQAATRRCGNAILLDRELDVWAMLTTSGNWTAGNVTTLTSGYQWNNGASASPIKNLLDMKINSIQPITEFWMNQVVANDLLLNVDTRDFLKEMLGDTGLATAVAGVNDVGNASPDFTIPGIGRIRISNARVKNETTGAPDFILGNHVVALTVPSGNASDGETPATTYTFRRRGPSQTGFAVRRFRVDSRGPEGGDMIVCYQADIAVMTGSNVGGLLINAHQ